MCGMRSNRRSSGEKPAMIGERWGVTDIETTLHYDCDRSSPHQHSRPTAG